MNKQFCVQALCLATLLCGCDNDSNDFAFSVYAEPSRFHAPGKVSFSIIRDDGGDLQDCTADWEFRDGVSLQGATDTEHTYTKPGKYSVGVSLSCGSHHGHETAEIEVFDSVDLGVSALDARPLDVSTNGYLNISFQLSNESESPLETPTYIDVYLTTSQEVDDISGLGSSRIYRHTLQSLPASGEEGAISKLDFKIPMSASIRTGTYYVAVVVNPDHNVGELSYDNNVVVTNQMLTVRNQLTDGADFVPVGFQVSPSRTSVLSSATAQLRVLNQGSTTAEEFRYEIWVSAKDNGSDMTDAVKVHEATISGGISGIEQVLHDVVFSITPARTDTGLYYFWIVLDSTNAIVERDEDNNVMRSEGPIQVTDEVMLDADILVNDVSFRPASASQGGGFTTEISLFNQGSQPTGSFICTFFLAKEMSLDRDRDYVIGTANIDDLLPMSSEKVTTVVETDSSIEPGQYWVFAFCDSSGVVQEANEDNNVFRSAEQISITGDSDVDLLFGPISVLEGSADSDGEKLNISAVLCNHGSTAAGPFQVSVGQMNLCDLTSKELHYFSVDGMDSGDCQTLYLKEPIRCDFWCPDYQLVFTADSSGIILENDETNNVAKLSENLSLSGDNCLCALDNHEPNDFIDQATKISSLSEDLTLCVEDVDLYLLDMQENGHFYAHLNHDSTIDQLSLELLRGSETQAVFEEGDDLYLEGVRLTGLTSEPAYIRVRGSELSAKNRYHLDIETYQTSTGLDLALSNLKINGGELNSTDPRVVTVLLSNLGTTAAQPFYLEYYLSRTANWNESDYRITRQSVTSLAPGSSIMQSTSLLMPENLSGGTYYLIARVDTNGQNDVRQENNYTRTDAWTFERKCQDGLDPNDSFNTARLLNFSGTFNRTDLTVCQTNPDFYAFDVQNGQSLDISVTGKTVGDFDLYLYDTNGNVIDSARTTASTETIHRNVVVGDQRMILEVRLLDNVYNATETSYSMSIQISEAPAYLICNAAFEPNDFQSSAYALRQAASAGQTASICPSTDEDYYSIALSEGDRLQLGFNTSSSLLRAALYNSSKEFLGMLTNLSTQTFDYTAVKDDIYYVRLFVNASTSVSQEYTLRWLASEGSDVAVHDLGLSTVSPYAGQTVTVTFTLDNRGRDSVSGEYRIMLQTYAGQTDLVTQPFSLTTGSSKKINAKVTIPVQVSGTASIIVLAENENDVALTNNSVSQSISISSACSSDSQEPNDNILQAVELSSSISATICPGDEDWFHVDLLSSGVITLDFSHSLGDLKLTAYSVDGMQIAESDTATNQESITLSPGKYYLRVMGVDNLTRNNYVLSIK